VVDIDEKPSYNATPRFAGRGFFRSTASAGDPQGMQVIEFK
jgi:hypothetical protein